ncbi:MAG: hypothetical protein HGB19_02585 [Chlorobiales bacterium]|nr:hypothetical protein [Chlorobiales bacterium]
MKTLITLIGIVAALTLTPRYATSQPKADFAYASPNRTLTFPKDHASHDDYRTEWWYYTGNLNTCTRKRIRLRTDIFPENHRYQKQRWSSGI